MADFRKWITVLFALALFAGLASAQSTLQCTASSAVTPQIRAESYADLMGDIVIACTGGPTLAVGQTIPQANIVIQTSVPVTSRLSSTVTGLSEALLLIDEPGSSLTPAVAGTGPAAPQVLCTTPSTGCSGAVAFSGTGIPYMPTTVPNVYQGYVSGSTVTFFGVPILPPASAGVVRTYRITNVRVNATQFLGVTGVSQTIAYISTNGATSLPVPYPAAVVTGFVQNSLTPTASTASTLLQCNAPSSIAAQTFGGVTIGAGAMTSLLTFKEQFGTAFKTRVVPLTATVASGTATNYSGAVSQQNIPGGVYTGFGLENSESGFIFPGANGSLTAGLADYGTRFKAVFSNIPAGITLYVSNYNLVTNGSGSSTTYSYATAPAGNAVTAFAVLVGGGASFAVGPEIAAVPTTGYTALTQTAGTAEAVWEVINANPNSLDTFQFGVFVNYAPNTASGLPTAPSVGTVAMGYAPSPADATAVGVPFASYIPRFVDPSYSAAFVNINICQTALLWPYVVVGGGFDTGLGIANTTSDPFSSAQGHVTGQTGSCNLYWYGQQYTPSGTTAATVSATTLGCDQTNAVAGACVGIGGKTGSTIASGQVWAGAASGLQSVTAGNTWIGYVIGLCNFQYAHGYAALSDIGARNWVTSYLALILQNGSVPVRGVAAEALNQ